MNKIVLSTENDYLAPHSRILLNITIASSAIPLKLAELMKVNLNSYTAVMGQILPSPRWVALLL